jgi:hypothetical protein
LNPNDGERFLKQNQQPPRPGQQFANAQLRDAVIVILGTRVFCKRSNKNPDPFLLKSLLKAAEDRLKAAS